MVMRPGTRGWWLASALVVALFLGGAPRSPAQTAPAATPHAPVTRLIVVSGVSGEKKYADLYFAWSVALSSAATGRFGIPDSLVSLFSEDTTRATKPPTIRSTRANVLESITKAVRASRPGDRIAILLLGHGNSQDDVPKLNLPGPDVTASDFATALRGSEDVTVLFANTASGSGEFVKALSGPNRIVVTATKSAREQNETTFPQFFIASLTSNLGDADKDGRVSVLEAFTYARREVERLFEQGNRIATEHAQLDDDGGRAKTFFLEPLGGASAIASSDPRAARLVEERRVLEGRIDSLRSKRSTMSESDYQKALEPLMLELAEKTRALRALEGKKP